MSNMGLLLASLALALIVRQSHADVTFSHSLDGASSFTTFGTLEGSISKGDLLFVRPAPTEAQLAALQALADKDQFYTVQFGPNAFSSVRASCFATPPQSIQETLKISVVHGEVVSVTYVVKSPACGSAAHGSRVSLPAKTLPVDVLLPGFGPQLLSEKVISGPGGQSNGASRPLGGATSRPLGAVPVAEGLAESDEGTERGDIKPQQPKEEQTWLQKNWLFVAGGVMVALNVLTSSARQANAPAPGGGGGGVARR